MFVHELKHTAAAACDAGHWIIGDNNRQAGFFHQQFVEVAQHRAAACQDNAALCDISAEFRWRLLERLFDGANNTLQWLLQSFEDFIAVQCETTRYAL